MLRAFYRYERFSRAMNTNIIAEQPKDKDFMRDWSMITLPPDDAIVCGHHGISKKGRNFINGLFDRIIQLEEEVGRKDKALLLAARWFKLSFDCKDDVPLSKADLGGMFDAMQEARLP